MDEVRVIEIKKSVFADNDEDADKLRKELKERGVYLLNLMSAWVVWALVRSRKTAAQ